MNVKTAPNGASAGKGGKGGRTHFRRLVLLPVLALALVLIFAAVSGARAVRPQTRFIEVDAQQFYYSPGIVEVNAGDRVILKFRVADVMHGFYLDGYELETKIKPGTGATLEFTADRPGRFMFRCSVTCGTFHPYMTGWFRVKPNSFLSGSLALTLIIGAGSVVYVLRKGAGK